MLRLISDSRSGSPPRADSGPGERWLAQTPIVVRLAVPEPVEWEKGTLQLAGQAKARVVSADGPIRLFGEWWADSYDRSYYWLTLADGSLCWVYLDHRDGRHYLHGVAD